MYKLLLAKRAIPFAVRPCILNRQSALMRQLVCFPLQSFSKEATEDFFKRINKYQSKNTDYLKQAEKHFENKKNSKLIEKEFKVKRNEEELMRKRFVRSREDAEFTRKAEREFKKKSLSMEDDDFNKMLDDDIYEHVDKHGVNMESLNKVFQSEEGNRDIDHPELSKIRYEREKFKQNKINVFDNDDRRESLEAEALLSHGIDPLKDHKETAKELGYGKDYLDMVERSGLTTKRNIKGNQDFGQTNPMMGDVPLEEYKSSIHSPSLFKVPKDADKKKSVDQFSDNEVKEFLESSNPDEFDSEMLDALYSRNKQIIRRDSYSKSGFKPSREHLEDETDLQVKLSKSHKEFEKATKLQQNIIDMELTKEKDKEFKDLIEKLNVAEDRHPDSKLPQKAKIVGFEDKKVIQTTNDLEEETDPVMIRVNKQLSYIAKSLNQY